jgi:beta-glucosidase
MSPIDAALLALRCDIGIVFGVRIEGQGFDNPDVSLP